MQEFIKDVTVSPQHRPMPTDELSTIRTRPSLLRGLGRFCFHQFMT